MQCGEHEMSRERCLDRDLRRFLVPDFTDEYDIRVMAENRAQSASKSQPRLLGHLNLVHAAKLILDWVFNRYDFPDGIIDAVQRRVERRSLAASRWTGDQDDAVR